MMIRNYFMQMFVVIFAFMNIHIDAGSKKNSSCDLNTSLFSIDITLGVSLVMRSDSVFQKSLFYFLGPTLPPHYPPKIFKTTHYSCAISADVACIFISRVVVVL